MSWPNPLSGTSLFTSWLNRLLDACRANDLLDGYGYKVKRTSRGKILEIVPGVGGGTATASITPLVFVSGDLHGSPTTHLWGFGSDNDCFTCAGQKVHAPPLLRFSVAARTAYGASFTYDTYDAVHQSRLAHNGAYSVTQYITPQYVVGDLIYVMDDGGVLQDMNVDGRVFAGPI